MGNGTGHGPSCLNFRASDGGEKCIFMSFTRKGTHLNLLSEEARTNTLFLVPQNDQSSMTLESKTKLSLNSTKAIHVTAIKKRKTCYQELN